MATTAESRRLTEAHRQTQFRLRAAAASDTLEIWRRIFDPSDIDASWSRMEPAVEAVTRDYRRQSSGLAAAYYRNHRSAEGVPGRAEPRLAAQPPRDALRYSLGFYGLVRPNELLRAGRPDVAQQAGVHLVGGVSRHVNDGGRETILNTVQADERARGWQRITAGDPCSFCAMIAARGAVFREGTANFESHDHCACSAEPVYSRGDQRPERAREWQQLWNESTRGVSGVRAQRNAFRRAYEGRA